MKKHFDASIAQALQNSNLSRCLTRFSERYRTGRARIFSGIDFEALRTKIAETKKDAAGRLDELAEQFKQSAEKKGATVFRTGDPAKAREYILNLAREKGVSRIVKSKSMATEEIHLNPILEAAGIKVDETDLGEWIVQLAGQKPSHLIMPASHLSKEEVADIFSKEMREPLPAEIPRLVTVARDALRPAYFEAGIGITGCNIAVAETGSIVLVTNEGNARLVTSIPKTHVVIFGVEKLVPRFEHIVPILAALPKSATCQLLTAYVSIITGPVPNHDGSMKDLHIILLDNHRTDMAKDPIFSQALQCIRCGACLNVCPVFRLVGGHVFGKIYTGGIGTILTAWFEGLGKSQDIQKLCIQCGNCKEVCPGKIDIPKLILELRRRLVKQEGLPFLERTALSIVNDRGLFHKLLRSAYLAQKPLAKDGLIRHLPLFFSGLVEHRSLPMIAPVPFQESFKKIMQPRCKEKAVFFSGCAINFVFPHIGEALTRVLNKAGIEVLYPQEQTCCGSPQRGSGAFDMAAESAEANIKVLLEEDAQYVVVACATCASSLKKGFAHVLKDQKKDAQAEEAEKLAEKTYNFSSLVMKLIEEGRLRFKDAQMLEKIAYHDSCHAKRVLGIHREPREVLQKCGYELAEMVENDMCCGMGGSYTIKHPDISDRMLERKLKMIDETTADLVVMECPGCLMQIAGGLDKSGSKMKAKHIAEIIVEQIA